MSRLQRGIDLTNASRSDNARPCKPLLALRHAQHGSASHVRLHPGSQTPLTVTTHCNNENSTAATERYGASRRMALACAGAALVAWRDPPTARAENGPLPAACLTEAGGAPGSSAAPVLLLPYSDPEGRFRMLRPCGWRQVTSLAPGSSVLASFYNPEEPGAETLAVYVGPPPELPERQRAVTTTADLGSPEAVAARLASSAPNGQVVDAHAVSRGGRSHSVVHVQFGGNTAGMFGAAREMRSVVVVQGVQYTLRVTTTRYRYLAYPLVRQWIREAADSFELLAA